jgi:hypothetical protein
VAQSLIGLRGELGEAWLALAREPTLKPWPASIAAVPRICLNGMSNLSRQFLALLVIAIPTPMGLLAQCAGAVPLRTRVD